MVKTRVLFTELCCTRDSSRSINWGWGELGQFQTFILIFLFDGSLFIYLKSTEWSWNNDTQLVLI